MAADDPTAREIAFHSMMAFMDYHGFTLTYHQREWLKMWMLESPQDRRVRRR